MWTVALTALLVSAAPAKAHSPTKPAVNDAAAKSRALYEQAQQTYDRGEIPEALALYLKAYDAKPLPGFLFNIGQCHRQLGHWETAARTYRSYLDQQPAAKNRTVVEGLIADMEARQKEMLAAAAASAPVKVTPPSPPPPGESLASGPPAPPPVAVASPLSASLVPPRESPPPTSTPVARRWYVWTAVGVVALGSVGLGLGLGLTQHPLPMGSLNSVDARSPP